MRNHTSIIAGLLVASCLTSTAWAQCVVTNEDIEDQGVVCTGTDADGVTVETPSAFFRVESGALVTSDAAAIVARGADRIDGTVNGRVEAGALGIDMGGLGVTSSLRVGESGVISSSGAGVFGGAILTEVTNAGTIEARDGFGVSFDSGADESAGEGRLATSHTLTNTGTIEATGPAVIADGPLSIVTSGRIASSGGTAIQADGGAFDSVRITGGRIVGDVLLGDGSDSFAFAGGAVEGLIDLGDGEDRVELSFATDDLASVVIGDALATAALTFSGGTVLSFANAELFAFRDRTVTFSELAALGEVPLPGAALLFASGLALAGTARRRRSC